MKTGIPTGILVLLTLTFSIISLPTARAAIVPTPGTTIETQWVPSGPASDEILLTIYPGATAEYNALAAGQLDLPDTPNPQFNDTRFCPAGTAFWCTPPTGPTACPSGQFAWPRGWQAVSLDPNATACVANFFTLLNMWNPNATLFGPIIRWGSAGGIITLNPYLAASQSGLHVLGEVYDTLLRPNPYSQTQILSWMVNAFTFVTNAQDANCPLTITRAGHGTFNVATCLKVNLRGDITFHNGVHLTASDVKFSFESFNVTGGSASAATLNTVDVVYNPAVLSQPFGQPQNLYIALKAASPSALLDVTEVPIVPQHVWRTAGSMGPCVTEDTPQCQVEPSFLTINNDPAIVGVANPSLIGSGPFVCASGPMGGAGTVVGQGCTSSGSSSVPAGGTVTLRRFGSGLTPASLAYFRNNADYAQWQWANFFGASTVNVMAISTVASCLSATPPLTGACLHYDTPARTLITSKAGPAIGLNSGGDSDGLVANVELSQVRRWFGTSWTDPIAYSTLSMPGPNGGGALPACGTANGSNAGACAGLFDDGSIYSSPPPPP